MTQAQTLADIANKVVRTHRIGRERFPRHLTGISQFFDESWHYRLPDEYADDERRDPWLR